jgi:hypothetical protein
MLRHVFEGFVDVGKPRLDLFLPRLQLLLEACLLRAAQFLKLDVTHCP